MIAAVMLVIGMTCRANAAGFWATVYDPDPAIFAANLRAAGVPTGPMDVLVAREVDRVFADREAALMPPEATAETEREWWTPARRAARLDLHREKDQMLRSVLGHAPDATLQTDWVHRLFPRLSDVHEDLVRDITANYDELRASLWAVGHGHETLDDLNMEIFLEQDRSDELREILTADEVTDYQLRNSRLGQKLRRDLECFEPTQEELRTCYRLLHELGVADDYLQTGIKIEIPVGGPFVGGPTRVYPRDRPAKRVLIARLELDWPAERVTHYCRAGSSYYRSVLFLARRLGLPDAVAEQILDSRIAISATEEEVRPYIGPQELMPSRNFGRFPGLVEEHCALVRSLLGAEGFAEYLHQHAGWIETMRQAMPVVFSLEW